MATTEPTNGKVVKTSSRAGSDKFGFSYASLSDLAKQKINIPKMRVAVIDGKQFVEYFDGQDWQTGAQIITDFESKGMNKAQAYGSALTYARRYTVQLAERVAVDDDKNIETAGVKSRQAPRQAEAYVSRQATDKQTAMLKDLLGDKFDEAIAKNQPLTIAKASKLIATIQAKKQVKADEPSAEPITADDLHF